MSADPIRAYYTMESSGRCQPTHAEQSPPTKNLGAQNSTSQRITILYGTLCERLLRLPSSPAGKSTAMSPFPAKKKLQTRFDFSDFPLTAAAVQWKSVYEREERKTRDRSCKHKPFSSDKSSKSISLLPLSSLY